jgi:hypothetical protein
MDRETKEITVGKHIFLARTYLTAREAQAIQQTYFKGTKLEIVGEAPKISEFNPAVQYDVQQEMIRQAVISMDGDTANIVDRCLDLPSTEYDTLVAELDALVSKKKK